MFEDMINLMTFQFDKVATILNLLFIKWLSWYLSKTNF